VTHCQQRGDAPLLTIEKQLCALQWRFLADCVCICRCHAGGHAVGHLFAPAAAAYGDRAARVTEIAERQKLGRRLVRGHPQLEAEVCAADIDTHFGCRSGI
jgi:hypothetical protein